MLKSGPLLALVVVVLQAATASAQTVIARNAPAGSTVELVLNTAKIGTATADALGDARLPFNLQDYGGKTEMDATVHVDICAEVRRILVVDKNLSPAVPEAGCVRKDVIGVFWVRRVSNLVVETGAVNATVFLRQGPVDLTPKGPASRWASVPTGLVVFGGAGLGWFRDSLALLCGDTSPCEGGDSRTTYLAGATVWLGPFLGIEGSYIKPAGVNANGTGSNFQFNSVQSSQIFLISGKVGIPAGRARIYGQGGTNYHRAKISTTETIDGAGSQTIDLKTGGWGWQFGGGLEVWVRSPFGIFGEVSRTRLKGEGLDDGHGTLDDYLTTALFGIRIKIGG